MARGTKAVNLALQGGGAHGALTWGVLDRLLEEDKLVIEGITATSAGAMNAAALKCGYVEGGNAGAKAKLDWFWDQIATRAAQSNPTLEWLRFLSPDIASTVAALQSNPAYFAGETLTRMFSPYELNPLDVNPLRDVLSQVCFHMEDPEGPKLFICATNVRTGKIKVFEGAEISIDAVLASACLPTLFRAVEIPDPATGEMEAYWDGGYIGNPALFPLFYETKTRDVLIVHINPLEREEVPRKAHEILNRINEISFNSSLLRELRNIDFVRRLIEEGVLRNARWGNRFKDVLIHSIRDDETMAKLGVATKLQPDRTMLEALKAKGREAANTFLKAHWNDLNERSTVDLRAMFQ
ncbi:patatin-like phospholipase family protein [Pontivivens ytuae]|uniref:Patatin-like phospholipase family protein n=1 Tax=Pontivivens ytuae TaxID=2789856 RepID=A0A7S9QDN4_9RHOB|nr:patatin-like phospholipase family protein [Pontivivens ytuae]QPH54321.1 patatin-like phospholipase family protein [Pontivivens ytuae]